MLSIGDNCKIKTIKEFENAYGLNWRIKFNINFTQHMNFMLGKEFIIEDKYYYGKIPCYKSVSSIETRGGTTLRWLIIEEFLSYQP